MHPVPPLLAPSCIQGPVPSSYLFHLTSSTKSSGGWVAPKWDLYVLGMQMDQGPLAINKAFSTAPAELQGKKGPSDTKVSLSKPGDKPREGRGFVSLPSPRLAEADAASSCRKKWGGMSLPLPLWVTEKHSKIRLLVTKGVKDVSAGHIPGSSIFLGPPSPLDLQTWKNKAWHVTLFGINPLQEDTSYGWGRASPTEPFGPWSSTRKQKWKTPQGSGALKTHVRQCQDTSRNTWRRLSLKVLQIRVGTQTSEICVISTDQTSFEPSRWQGLKTFRNLSPTSDPYCSSPAKHFYRLLPR